MKLNHLTSLDISGRTASHNKFYLATWCIFWHALLSKYDLQALKILLLVLCIATSTMG